MPRGYDVLLHLLLRFIKGERVLSAIAEDGWTNRNTILLTGDVGNRLFHEDYETDSKILRTSGTAFLKEMWKMLFESANVKCGF